MNPNLSPEHKKTLSEFHSENKAPYLVSELTNHFAEIEGVYNATMDDNVSGYIKKNEKGKYRIVVNKNHPEVRQRFTAAHELAHYLLHKNSIGDGITEDALFRSESLSNLQEVEANKLAAEILMPYPKIFELLEQGVTFNDLPKRFRVSALSMSIRLGVTEEELLVSDFKFT